MTSPRSVPAEPPRHVTAAALPSRGGARSRPAAGTPSRLRADLPVLAEIVA